ncbi:MAG: hypothetical protein H0X30_32440 [Anaerolineae bacterium]|nr:hypothetical protein [Anaerolineae bacterium]
MEQAAKAAKAAKAANAQVDFCASMDVKVRGEDTPNPSPHQLPCATLSR